MDCLSFLTWIVFRSIHFNRAILQCFLVLEECTFRTYMAAILLWLNRVLEMLSCQFSIAYRFLKRLGYFNSSICQRVSYLSVEGNVFLLILLSLAYRVLNVSPFVRNKGSLRANYELAFLWGDWRCFNATWSSPIHFLYTLHVFLEVAHGRPLFFLSFIVSLCRWEQI